MGRHKHRNALGRFARLRGEDAAPFEAPASAAARRIVPRDEAPTARTVRDAETVFFRELSMVCNVSSALRRSKLGGDPYERRRLDADFRRRWDEAIAESYPLLELEMLERARFGDNRPAARSEVEKRLREVPTAVAVQLLKYYHSRAKAAGSPPAEPVRRTARAEAVAVRRQLLEKLAAFNRRMGGEG